MLRFLLWRLLGLFAILVGFALLAWFLDGGPGRVLRGGVAAGRVFDLAPAAFGGHARSLAAGSVALGPVERARARAACVRACSAGVAALAGTRGRARRRRRYVRLYVEAYRGDHASSRALTTMFAALHKRLLRRWWRRLALGQESIALEVHHAGDAQRSAWLAICCPEEHARIVEAAVQGAYPNCRLRRVGLGVGAPPALLRLKKRAEFIERVSTPDPFAREPDRQVDRLLTVMRACGERAFVQFAITPTPALFETFAKHVYKRREAHLSRARREHLTIRDRSMVEDAELRGGLEIQHRPLFFADLRVIAPTRAACERIASELRAEGAENRLVERGTGLRHGVLGLYTRRVERGEGNPLPSFRKGVLRLHRARRDVAAAVGRLRDRPVRAQQRAARAGSAGDLPARGRSRHAARRRSGPSRSMSSCASRTRPCQARSSRASRATWWQPSPRTFAASAAR